MKGIATPIYKMLSIVLTAVVLISLADAVPPPSVCGKPTVKPHVDNGRVVGGREAKPNSWPWQVQLRYSGNFFCGGSLLSPDWVLTAAHCVQGKSVSGFSIRAGRHTRTELKDPTDSKEQAKSAKQIIKHESYSQQNFNNDVALIRLSSQFMFNDYVSAACLSDTEPPGGTKVYIVGWGKVQGTCCDGRLKQALIPVIDRSKCSSFQCWGSKITPGMICAGELDGTHGGCNGDSGGPLMTYDATKDIYELVGVVSWGSRTCTDLNKPGVFANVKYYKKWITTKLVQAEAEEELMKAKKFNPRLGAAFRAFAKSA